MWLFVVAVGYFVFSTLRQRLLAVSVRCSLRDEARQLVAAGGALAVDGSGVCRGYSCGSSSWRRVALCSQLVGSDDWHCQHAAGCVVRLDSTVLQAVFSPSVAVKSEEAAREALRRRRWQRYVLNALAAMAGIASLPSAASKELLVWLFIVAASSFMSQLVGSNGKARQLDAGGRTRVVDGVGRGYPRWGMRLDSSRLRTAFLLLMAVAAEQAACVALRRRCRFTCVLNSSTTMTGRASTPLVVW